MRIFKKKVSVIVPCHNAVEWLPQCFLSLIRQTIGMENLELIFVDDASTDQNKTWSLLTEFECAYPNDIIVIQLEKNLRQGGARNEAMKYATGEYIAFVDSDDYVEENFLEKVYERAKQTDADIVQFEYFYYLERAGAVSNGRNVSEELIVIDSVDARKQFLMSEKITYGCWNKLYRKQLILEAGVKYAEHMVYEEPLFVYPLLFFGNRFAVMKEPFYYYRQNEAGTMRNDMENIKTLQMHADVQRMLWKFMKKTTFFKPFYEEIKLYFLHTYFYETLYFAKLRGFQITMDFYQKLASTVKKEVKDYHISAYEELIPRQMELYRLTAEGMTEEQLLLCTEKWV